MSADPDSTNPPISIAASSVPKKRKKSLSSSHRAHTTLRLSHPPYAYLHLFLTSSSSISTTNTRHTGASPKQSLIELDALTIRTHLTVALSSFLGLTGTAIPIDVMKHSGYVNGENDIWIRVPTEDRSAVVAALGAWMGRGDKEEDGTFGWRVLDTGAWLPGVVGSSVGAQALFDGVEKNAGAG